MATAGQQMFEFALYKIQMIRDRKKNIFHTLSGTLRSLIRFDLEKNSLRFDKKM